MSQNLSSAAVVIGALRVKKNIVFFFLKIFLTFTNNVDTNEMQNYVAFHQGLHCLHKYSLKGFPNSKG